MFEGETFQYVFTPNCGVVDLMGLPLPRGILGFNLDPRRDRLDEVRVFDVMERYEKVASGPKTPEANS